MSDSKRTEEISRGRPSIIGGPGGGPGPFRSNTPVTKPKDRIVVIRRLWDYLKPYAGKLAALGLVVAGITVLQLGGPYLQGTAIDNAIVPGDLPLLMKYLIALVALYAVISALSLIQQWSMIRLGQDFIKRLRGELFSKIQFLPLKFHDTHPHGDTMSRVTNDVDTINRTVTASLPQIISSVLTIIGVVTMMLIVNWQMAMVTLITIPLVAFVTQKIAKRSRSAFKSQRVGIGKLNGTIEESVSGLKAIILFRRQKETINHFASENHDVRIQSVRAQIFGGVMGPIMGLMRNINFAIVVIAGGFFATRGWVSVGMVVTFLLYARQFTRPLNEIAQLYNTIQSALAGAERIFEAMDEEPEPEDTGSNPLSDGMKLVEFEDVTFSYVPGQPVLKRVSITALKGQTVALVGPTGAGKTTIINLLARFYDIDDGMIRVDGRDITEIPRDSLRRSLGVVLQDTFLFSDTVMENIRYGRLNATDEEVMEAARLAYADHFIVHLPQQYQTTLTESGSNLSQGQRQLIAIARAILANSTILVLDEATSNVDTRTEVHIQKAMRRLMQGRTTFVIAHRLNTVRNADRIVVINDGEVAEQGTHDELLRRKGVYAELHNSQFSLA
jgi:ATP-binding cassette, subfamily B, multidrug efflux pump